MSNDSNLSVCYDFLKQTHLLASIFCPELRMVDVATSSVSRIDVGGVRDQVRFADLQSPHIVWFC